MKQLLSAKIYSDDLMTLLAETDERFRQEITLQLIDTLNYQSLIYIKEKAEMRMEELYPTKKDTAKVPEVQTNYNTEDNDPCTDCQYNKSGRCESYLPCLRKDTGRMTDD